MKDFIMFHTLLFLTAQLLTLTFSNSLRPMTPDSELSTTTTITTSLGTTTQSAINPISTIETQPVPETSSVRIGELPLPDQTTQTTKSLHNNVLVFLNECIKNPSDNLLNDHFIYLKRYSGQAHFLITIDTLKKVTDHIKKLFSGKFFLNTNENIELKELLALLSNIYYINDSQYCLSLPSKNNTAEISCDHNTPLDLTNCTLMFDQELLNQDFNETFFETLLNRMKKILSQKQDESDFSFFEKLLNRIEEIESTYTLVEPSKQKKESDIFKQLFAKQIAAHNFFAADLTAAHSHIAENYALATQPWNFVFHGHGAHMHSIAGFFFGSEELWKTLKVLNHLSTGYLIILSCHAGGENREVLSNPSIFMKESRLLNPLYEKFEPILLGFNISYPIVLTSPSNSILTINPATINSIIERLITKNVSEDALIESIIAQDFLYNTSKQINKLPLILYPHQTSFKPLQSKKSDRFLHHIINDSSNFNTVTERIFSCKNKVFSVEDKSVIQTNLSIFSHPLAVTPTNNKTAYLDFLCKFRDLNAHEKHLPEVFPVVSDTNQVTSKNIYGNIDIQYPSFPSFLSQQPGNAYHYIPTLIIKKTDAQLFGESGVFLSLRNLFFNANRRSTKQLFYIKRLIGENDLPKNIVDQLILKNILDKNFPLSGEPIILNDVVTLTYYGDSLEFEDDSIIQSPKNPGHHVFCAFSHKESYYFFTLKIEDYIYQKNWGFLNKLPSKEAFEQKITEFENLTCSTIYDRLKSYPASHPQYELIKQYLDHKKSIFLDFEKSYPLFKDNYLPEDANAWEKISELVKKHKEILGDLAGQQLDEQQRFTCIMNKLKQHRELNEMQALLPALTLTEEI